MMLILILILKLEYLLEIPKAFNPLQLEVESFILMFLLFLVLIIMIVQLVLVHMRQQVWLE